MTNQDKPSFSEYGEHFQEQIFQALIHDPKWAEQLLDIFEPTYFDLKHLIYLSEKYFEYARKYKVFPTLNLLVTIIKDELKQGKDKILKEHVVKYLVKIKDNPEPGDLPFVKEKTQDFCKKQALKIALEEAVEHLHTGKYENCVEVVKKAVLAGSAPDQGHDFFEDYESRFTKLQRNCIETGIPQLDQKDILNGGMGRGELFVVIAPTGVGKCSYKDTLITVQYDLIAINGKEYKPWDKVPNDVKNVIERKSKIEHMEISTLFSLFGIEQNAETNTEDNETLKAIDAFNIKVLSKSSSEDNTFHKISALRLTDIEALIEIKTTLSSIKCSPDHILGTTQGWLKAKDIKDYIKYDDFAIFSVKGFAKVLSISTVEDKERLYDLQVDDVHSYFTNGLLSHNSHFMTYLGANALRQHKNVIHYTMELSEQSIGLRYDSNLCDLPSNEIIDKKDQVLEAYKGMSLGKLFIKQYPPNMATVYTLRSHIEKLMITKGIKPDLIIIDYADIMRSTRQFDALRHELKLVYEELRALAIELGVPIVTASQSNKDGSSSDVIDLTNMSESYGKAMVADVVLSISRKPEEKATGAGRIFVAKNRAGRDGLLYNCQIDTAKSMFKVAGSNVEWAAEKNNDERETKRRLRERLAELEKDKVLNPNRDAQS